MTKNLTDFRKTVETGVDPRLIWLNLEAIDALCLKANAAHITLL